MKASYFKPHPNCKAVWVGSLTRFPRFYWIRKVLVLILLFEKKTAEDTVLENQQGKKGTDHQLLSGGGIFE
ncbi:hypothetical protein AAK899_10035 [Erysipelotrichaceae bacterium 51-3]